MRSLAVVAVLLVAGCSAGGDATSGGEGADAPPAAEDSSGGAPGDGSDEGSGTGSAVGDEDAEQQFITTGSVTMVVEDPAEQATEAARVVEAAGGHVQERVQQAGAEDQYASAYLVVRIPADEVTPTLEALEQLGEVRDTSLQSEEVTKQVRDLEARIRALEISIGRLEGLLERAGTVSDIVEAEQVLTERQSELEVLLSQQASLADDVALSTFRIEMYTAEGEPEAEPTGFFAGLVAGWDALVTTLTGLTQVVGALLPWVVFAALVTAAVLAIRRAVQRRRGPAAPAGPYPGGPAGPSGPGGPAGPGGPPGGGPTTSLPPTGPTTSLPTTPPAPVPVGATAAPVTTTTAPLGATGAPAPAPAAPVGATAAEQASPAGQALPEAAPAPARPARRRTPRTPPPSDTPPA